MDPVYCSGIIYACSQATNLSMGCKWLCVESSGGVRVIYISTICCNNKNMHSTNQSYFFKYTESCIKILNFKQKIHIK